MSPEEWLASQKTTNDPRRVPPNTQARRDTDRLEILRQELHSARARVAAGDSRASGDVAALEREISRAGGKPTTAAQAPVAVPATAAATAKPAMSPEEWLASQQKAPATPAPTSEEPRGTTVGGVVGAVTRGLAPVATGAALGALAGAPTGIGAIPGAVAGAGAGTLAVVVGDPIVNTINSLFGTQFTRPTDAMEALLTKVGVAQPKTEAERIIQSTVQGATTAGGTAAAGQAVAKAAASPVTRAVATQVAAQPVAQIAGGAGAGAASQAAQEAGFSPVGQVVAGVVGGMAGARAVAPRTPVRQLPSDLDDAERAGIKVMTSDVVPPRTFAQKWMQVTGERMPVAGTGPVRQMQQEQRVQAVKDIAQDFGVTDAQITTKNIWNDLAAKRGKDLTKYKSAKDAVIDKISTAQSNRVLGEQMLKEADDLTQKAGKLYADQAKLVNRVADLQRRNLGWAGEQRINRLNQRIAEYRSTIEEAQQAAVQKRQLAQTMVEDVTGKAVDLPRTVQSIDEQITKLTDMKTDAVRPVINILKDWKSAVQGQDLKNIELLRKQLGESFKSPELGSVRSVGEASASSIYRSLVEDMGDFIKANGDRRDYTQWKVANARLADMMGEVNKTALSTVLKKGDTTPEVVNNMLFSQKPSEVAQLYRNLTPTGRAHARTAIIARAVEKAGGIDHVSPDRFANQVRDLGKSINIFFAGDDLKRIEGLARVLNMTKRATEASVLPPSGVQNFYAMLGIGAGGVGAGLGGAMTAAGGIATIGAAARIYESAAVRNMLLKFPQLRPGSAEEAEMFKRLMATLAAQQTVETPPTPEIE